MNRRLVGVALALSALLLGCFAGLAADPSALIVDADHPSVDRARPFDDPSPGNDLTRLFLPHHLAIARAISRVGHLPLWDDRGFGGRPLVGNPQAGLFYPPTWLAWWSEAPAALGWITVGHLLLAGLGTYRLARTLRIGGWGCLVAAGCFQVSPYLLAQTCEGHYPHVWAACWYPWAFEATIRLRGGERRAALALSPILAATFLVGHPQEGFYLSIALGGWAAFDVLAAIGTGAGRATFGNLLTWAGASVLTVGLIGIELVPHAMAQMWGLGGAGLTLRQAGRYHLYPINLLQLLDPRALGGPADYFGHDNYWESVLSIGLIPLSLAIIAATVSPDRRSVRGWLMLVVASVLFASGRKLGVFALLFETLPGMDRFRVSARSLFLASLGASMLAGIGVDALRARSAEFELWGRLVRRSGRIAAILTLVLLLGRGLAESREVASTVLQRSTVTLRDLAVGLHPRNRATEIDRMLLGLSRITSDPTSWMALGGMTLGLTLGARPRANRRAIAAALGLLGLVELGLHGHALIKTAPVARFLGPDPIGEAILRARPPGLEPPRLRAVDTLYDDLRAGQLGLTKTNVHDSFQIGHAADLYRSLYHLFDADLIDRRAAAGPSVVDHRREVRQAVLDRMGVSLLVADRLLPEAPWRLVASGTRGVSTFAVYRNSTALPRAYVVPRVEVAPDDPSIVDRFGQVDPRQSVLMPTDPLGAARSPRQPFTPAEWASTDPDRLVLRVTTGASGLLVIAETWMPGWRAQVDGKAAPVLRGNRSQRVVPLPEPGRHEIVLRYWPPGLTIGLASTIGSGLLWLALLVGTMSRKDRSSPGSRP